MRLKHVRRWNRDGELVPIWFIDNQWCKVWIFNGLLNTTVCSLVYQDKYCAITTRILRLHFSVSEYMSTLNLIFNFNISLFTLWFGRIIFKTQFILSQCHEIRHCQTTSATSFLPLTYCLLSFLVVYFFL